MLTFKVVGVTMVGMMALLLAFTGGKSMFFWMPQEALASPGRYKWWLGAAVITNIFALVLTFLLGRSLI